jgi:glucosamine-6-phosphate deaminase
MAGKSKSKTISRVEELFLERSGYKLQYPPTEKIGVIVVDNFPLLGKLAALRFLEWVQANPGGVISLPTGKTPEYFIKYVSHYLNTWDRPETKAELEQYGLDPSVRPEMKSLRFVQIDEFYPIDPAQHNSFYYYVNRFYISKFRLDPQKALLIDCSRIGLPPGYELEDVWPDAEVDLTLRFRHPKTALERLQKQVLEAVDQWCQEYEEKIRAMGGIGFFLGGIGPDGHIAFNVRGSDHNSTTRLTPTNYETQAAAATDLGGIEVARKRLVITIGLATITMNPDCTAIILAAGEAKAKVVRDAVEEPAHIHYPATALHKLPNARFYVTRGAAKLLKERQLRDLEIAQELPDEWVDKIVIDLAVKSRTRVLDLREEQFRQDPFGSLLLAKLGSGVEGLKQAVDERLRAKLSEGARVRTNTVFLHTAPHHDDILLGYLPFAVRHIRDASNRHVFACMTSGFTAVTNRYALSLLQKLRYFLRRRTFEPLLQEGYFDPRNQQGRNRDVWQYLDGIASDRQIVRDEGEARRLLRNLMEVFEEEDVDNLRHRINELISYFETQYPGKKDLPYIQQLKGMIREWEEDCLWGYFGFDSSSVVHLRLGFYTGDIFTEEPTLDRDVLPILRLLRRVKPDVVTVALDPEASGPDTHYKVLQAIAEALKQYEKESGRSDIEVIGYRNVWYRFHPSEANLFVPVSLNMFAILQNAFSNAYASQKEASFPSYEYDGPFSGLAQQIQAEQYQIVKTCLGRSFFYEHPSPLIRATRGLVFLKRMNLREFYQQARELRRVTEEIAEE